MARIKNKTELKTHAEEYLRIKAEMDSLKNQLEYEKDLITKYMASKKTDEVKVDDIKITYKERQRTSLDKDRLVSVFGKRVENFENVTYYKAFSVK